MTIFFIVNKPNVPAGLNSVYSAVPTRSKVHLDFILQAEIVTGLPLG